MEGINQSEALSVHQIETNDSSIQGGMQANCGEYGTITLDKVWLRLPLIHWEGHSLFLVGL